MNGARRVATAAVVAALLSGCGVRGQAKPEKIEQPTKSPTPTPSIERSICPSPTPTSTTARAPTTSLGPASEAPSGAAVRSGDHDAESDSQWEMSPAGGRHGSSTCLTTESQGVPSMTGNRLLASVTS